MLFFFTEYVCDRDEQLKAWVLFMTKASGNIWHSLSVLGNRWHFHGSGEPSVVVIVVHEDVQIFILQVNSLWTSNLPQFRRPLCNPLMRWVAVERIVITRASQRVGEYNGARL